LKWLFLFSGKAKRLKLMENCFQPSVSLILKYGKNFWCLCWSFRICIIDQYFRILITWHSQIMKKIKKFHWEMFWQKIIPSKVNKALTIIIFEMNDSNFLQLSWVTFPTHTQQEETNFWDYFLCFTLAWCCVLWQWKQIEKRWKNFSHIFSSLGK
jgi:hypothetical protein